MILPADPGPLPAAFAPAFAQPTYARFLTLLGAAILTTGRRTIANVLRTAGRPTPPRCGDGGACRLASGWSLLTSASRPRWRRQNRATSCVP